MFLTKYCPLISGKSKEEVKDTLIWSGEKDREAVRQFIQTYARQRHLTQARHV